MSEIIIHAGTHKTATTTIQETLHRNRAALAARDIVYPALGRAAGHHLLAAEWLDHLARYRDARSPEKHWADLAGTYAGGETVVLVSSEEFARKGPQQVDLHVLRARTAAFGRRRIVFVLRDQLSYIQSLYLQMQRQYRLPEFGDYVRQCLAQNHASGMYLDYTALYDRALAAFAPEEVTLIPYGSIAGGGAEITGAFLAALGLAADLELAPLPSGRANVSPEPLGAWAANKITAPATADSRMVALATAVVRDTLGPTAKTTLFARAEAEAVRAHFEPLNRALEARYRAVDPGFALDPIEVRDSLVYRNTIPAALWLKLARRIYRSSLPASAPA
jgi:hypothetical protein